MLWVLIESPILYETMTWYQNMEIFALLSKVSKSRWDFDEILTLVGLDDKSRNKKIKTYSLGMKQRLAIAIALVWNPEILILDEPLNGIDIEWVIEFCQMLHRLQGMDITIIISSHILSEIEKICTHIWIISSGMIKFNSSIKEFLSLWDNIEQIYLNLVRK